MPSADTCQPVLPKGRYFIFTSPIKLPILEQIGKYILGRGIAPPKGYRPFGGFDRLGGGDGAIDVTRLFSAAHPTR
jgi:hypothetical protein